MTHRKDFDEGLQWGYGYSETKKKGVRSRKQANGFRVESAEYRDTCIVVKAVNNYGKPARVSGVEIDEIYPEPQEKRFFIIVQSKDRERFPCDSKVQGFNLVNPDEIVKIEVRPLRPLKEEYGYEITVLRQLSDEEQERQWDRHGPFVAYDRGVPGAYVYRNGRLEEPQAKRESSPTGVENKFCIHCGAQISSTAKYCLKCGEKQNFE